ncbi:choline kinase [Dysgonomonas alginatilytica]|uniref:Choline kinase n=1 Tax=Dysgonomonas alginatilytica TaxID=1605892 RepID=A0A2V3PMQ2_9BACT|nr:phosphocholine cytidylyltransferase family protein [Dysgonomonas alginatilytica]PXV63336.1 choline kinase [Dysgonomonas alginatilytica]
MKAVILAAGIASRLRPLTNNTPKCLLEVGSKCLLGRTIDSLISNGFKEFVVVTGYLKEMIEDYISVNYPKLQVEYIFNEKYASTNNIYSLWMTKEAVKGQDIMLLDSDILFDSPIITALLESPHKNCLALNSHELGDEEIKVIVDDTNRIKEISKVCSIKDAVGESVGIEKFSAPLVKLLFDEMDDMILNKNQSGIFYEAAFENIIEKGADMYIVDTTNIFSMELDTVEDFETACKKLPSHLL